MSGGNLRRVSASACFLSLSVTCFTVAGESNQNHGQTLSSLPERYPTLVAPLAASTTASPQGMGQKLVLGSQLNRSDKLPIPAALPGWPQAMLNPSGNPRCRAGATARVALIDAASGGALGTERSDSEIGDLHLADANRPATNLLIYRFPRSCDLSCHGRGRDCTFSVYHRPLVHRAAPPCSPDKTAFCRAFIKLGLRNLHNPVPQDTIEASGNQESCVRR